MDLDRAVAAHAQWKIRLRGAIANGDQLDAASVSADNCCELGKWLHGDARRLADPQGLIGDCTAKHAEFHRQAGQVARAINAKRMDDAERMLAPGTAYSNASNNVGVALLRLKRQIAPA
jgi:methyl-accepting chemotaxis protein